MTLVVYCADIGSIPNCRFGWARADTDKTAIQQHRGGTEIVDLVAAVLQGTHLARWQRGVTHCEKHAIDRDANDGRQCVLLAQTFYVVASPAAQQAKAWPEMGPVPLP